MVWKPAATKARINGSPTYPNPMTPTVADLFWMACSKELLMAW